MYKIIYDRAFGSEKEARSALKKAETIASNPKIIKGKVPNVWLVQLYECNTKEKLEEGMYFYKQKGARVFRYE